MSQNSRNLTFTPLCLSQRPHDANFSHTEISLTTERGNPKSVRTLLIFLKKYIDVIIHKDTKIGSIVCHVPTLLVLPAAAMQYVACRVRVLAAHAPNRITHTQRHCSHKASPVRCSFCACVQSTVPRVLRVPQPSLCARCSNSNERGLGCVLCVLYVQCAANHAACGPMWYLAVSQAAATEHSTQQDRCAAGTGDTHRASACKPHNRQ